MTSFNFTSCVPMWLPVASLGPWLEFLGLVNFWFWLSFLVALTNCNRRDVLLANGQGFMLVVS